MKILHINTHDCWGGAAIAAKRLHRALSRNGVESVFLAQNNMSEEVGIISSRTMWQKLSNKLKPTLDALPAMLYKNRREELFSTAYFPTSFVHDVVNEVKPDVINLHWINHGMLRIEDLSKFDIPIVWTLHDDWAFTGGCHVKRDCNHYKSGCGKCPALGSNAKNDLSSKTFQRKAKVFSQLDDLTIVAVSQWLKSCSLASSLLRNKKTLAIPNTLDTNVFKPLDKIHSRNLLGVPADKKLIAFGANSATNDRNKGFEELTQALNWIDKDKVECIVFGSSEPECAPNVGIKIHYLGRLNDELSLTSVYNAADVMVVPSLQESFGQTASESLSCGTPVVAFAHSGLLDIVDHKHNGYLAEPFSAKDLAKGIDWVLTNQKYSELSENAREKAVNTFDFSIVSGQYVRLYKDVISQSR